MGITKAELQVAQELFGEKLKRTISNQRAQITKLMGQLETAERQVRDIALENERLRRMNASLRSSGGPHA